jgi:diaminopimelate epimerase
VSARASISFVKVHGAGNDFVLIDETQRAHDLVPADARRICDRHLGVGADGVLLVRRDPDGVHRMVIWNADGSVAEMCGNGIRCVARYLHEALDQRAVPIPIRTDAGPRPCRVEVDGAGRYLVTVAMGRAQVAAADETVRVDGRDLRFRRVSTGNPHAIVASEDPMADARALGPAIETDPLFPARTNVEFVREDAPGRLTVVVHERGCGITQACGTGATAVAAARFAYDGSAEEARYEIALPGGTVVITRDARGELLLMGEAAVVFRGVLEEMS